MQEIKVNSKFGIGDSVVTIKSKSVEYMCPNCKGRGTVKRREHSRYCPHCYGSGNLYSCEKLWEIDAKPIEITNIKISISSDGNQNITYGSKTAKGNKKKRVESHCFTTIEEAQAYCDSLNVEIRAKIEKEIQVMQAKYDAMHGD